MTADWIVNILQLVVGLGLLNVWLVRARSSTSYRGGDSKTLKEEFAAYGLPEMAFYIVGILKVGSAIVLILGIWLNLPVRAATIVIAGLMVGALAMHVKVKDPVTKSVPAFVILVLCVVMLVI